MSAVLYCLPVFMGIVHLSGQHEFGTECMQALPTIGELTHRPNCSTNAEIHARLQSLRNLFDVYHIDGYLVSTEDAHQRKRTSAHDKRLYAITGFSGVIGTALITRDKLALWTDGRNFNEADQVLNCGWVIFRKGFPSAPVMTTWVKKELKGEKSMKLGASPFFTSSAYWQNFNESFNGSNLDLVEVFPELIDLVWKEDRPPEISVPINALADKFSGKNWRKKVQNIYTEMAATGTDVMLISELDEIAWLFNMRATSFGFSPFFFSFAILNRQTRINNLYIIDHTQRLNEQPTDPESLVTIAEHLGVCSSGNSCHNDRHNHYTDLSVQVFEYDLDRVKADLYRLAHHPTTRRVWLSPYVNYGLFSAVPKSKVFQHNTPALIHKSLKNPTERRGMQASNLMDSAAVVCFFARLEKEVRAGKHWTVYRAAQEVNAYRRRIPTFRGLSFSVLSGAGPTASHIHRSPDANTSRRITTNDMFLQDSGAQYIDPGTSDLSRVFHYGNSSPKDKELYTRVLLAHVNLARHVWPKGRHGHELDAVARQSLWEIGSDYPHHTGHMIGAFGGVSEGPGRISSSFATYRSEVPYHASLFTAEEYIHQLPDVTLYPLQANNFITIEPGFYETGKTGVRLENVFQIVEKTNLKFQNLTNCEFLGFDPITFVPYERHLIDMKLLGPLQIQWIDAYHQRVWKKLQPILSQWNETEALSWVRTRVRPLQGT